MIKRSSAAVLLAFFLLHGCASQIISEQVKQGALVKEEGSGKITGRSRKKTIELVSPFSVRVGEQVREEEETKLFYQKVLVRKKARPRHYPYLDAFIKVLASTSVFPLFTGRFWTEGSYVGTNCSEVPDKCSIREASDVVSRDFFVEDGTRWNLRQFDNAAPPDKVAIFINGYYREELPVSSAGTVTVDLLKYRDLAETRRDVRITFKYFDSYAYSVIRNDEVKRIFRGAAAGAVSGSPL